MNFLSKFFQTEESISHLVLRIALGIVIFPHGAQKVLGWFGGHGFEGTMGFFTQKMGLPVTIAFLVIIGEFLGSLGLIAGFLTRFCAGAMVCIQLGAVLMVHFDNGFFMNWSGQQPGEGFEYHILAIGIAIPLVLMGGGKFSADKLIVEKFLNKDMN